LYFNDLLPERFGRKRQYALGKTSGKAIEKNLQELGLKLNAEDLKLVTRIIEWETKVTREDLPYIISDVWTVKRTKKNSGVLCIITR
jgi:D-citramalate synthase